MKQAKPWLLFFTLVIVSYSAAEAQSSIIITNGEWPPFMSQNLKHDGVVSHIITEVFARSGVAVEFGFFPWNRSFFMAETGAWDATAVWSKIPEREAKFYYSDPVLQTRWVFFHLKSYPFQWQSIQDLKGIKIGATYQYEYGPEFNVAEKNGDIFVERIKNDELNFKKLLKGRIDIFPQELDVGWAMIHGLFEKSDIKKFTYHLKPVKTTPLFLLFSKNYKHSQKILKRFNESLADFRKSGDYDRFFQNSRNGNYTK